MAKNYNGARELKFSSLECGKSNEHNDVDFVVISKLRYRTHSCLEPNHFDRLQRSFECVRLKCCIDDKMTSLIKWFSSETYSLGSIIHHMLLSDSERKVFLR